MDLEIQEPGPQEGDGNGRSLNRMQTVKENINQKAESFRLTQRFDQIKTGEQRPSIFMPPVPMVAQTPPLDRSGAAASSRGSTGRNVIVAAVGPYHHHQSEAQSPLITPDKKCVIVEFLARLEFGLDIDAFLKWARDNDARARECYEWNSCTMLPEEKLAEMLLLDGCLVLFAVFVLSVREDQRPPELHRTTELGKEFINLSADISQDMKETRLDLLVLGNQIPFFVLVNLHSRVKDTIFFRGIDRIEKLALSCFDDTRPCPSGFIKQDGEALVFPQPIHHLLHLFHWSRVPPGPGKRGEDDSPPLIGEPELNVPCATWFENSRISFSTHAAAPGTLHMVFQRNMLGARGVLRVPALHIHAYSDHVFRNLIVFEQSHLMSGLAVTTYCICMARLLQSEEDAKLLRRSGILAHTHETDKEIVALFRGLADEYRHASYSRDLLDLCKDVEAHHHSTAARAVKWVALQCFPRQTVTFFVILGALISIATLINTIYSVYRFYHPVRQ